MLAEPAGEVRQELQSLAPGKDAAGIEYAEALLVDRPVLCPVFHRIAPGWFNAPFVPEPLRRAVHGVGHHRVD